MRVVEMEMGPYALKCGQLHRVQRENRAVERGGETPYTGVGILLQAAVTRIIPVWEKFEDLSDTRAVQDGLGL